MKIYLIRHGISVTNEKHMWTGQLDVELSENGIKKIMAVKKRFDFPTGDVYIASPLKRCIQTTELIYGRRPDVFIDELMECSLGVLEGTPYSDLTDDTNYINWQKYPDSIPFAEGESFNQFLERTHRGFEKVLELSEVKNYNKVVIILHGNVMRSILHGYVAPAIPHKEWKIPNIGVYELEVAERRVVSYKTMPEFLFENKQ